jgi:hypothetical protein
MKIKRHSRNGRPSKKQFLSSEQRSEVCYPLWLSSFWTAFSLVLQYYYLKYIASGAWPPAPWHQFYLGLSNAEGWFLFVLVEAIWFLFFGMCIFETVNTIWVRVFPPASQIPPAEQPKGSLLTSFLQEAPEVRDKIIEQVLLKIQSKGFDYASIEQNVITAVNIHGKPVTILIASSERVVPKLSDFPDLQKVLSLSAERKRPCFFAPVLIKFRLPYPGFRNQIEPSQISFECLIPIEK